MERTCPMCGKRIILWHLCLYIQKASQSKGNKKSDSKKKKKKLFLDLFNEFSVYYKLDEQHKITPLSINIFLVSHEPTGLPCEWISNTWFLTSNNICKLNGRLFYSFQDNDNLFPNHGLFCIEPKITQSSILKPNSISNSNLRRMPGGLMTNFPLRILISQKPFLVLSCCSFT